MGQGLHKPATSIVASQEIPFAHISGERGELWKDNLHRFSNRAGADSRWNEWTVYAPRSAHDGCKTQVVGRILGGSKIVS